MAFITNLDMDQVRVYNKDKTDINKDMMVDNAAMPKDIEDNLDILKGAAIKTLRAKKPKYDFKTSNKSFLDLYNDLYHLGIKNNKFFLKLYDQDLVGINPYQSILPLELQLKIIVECMINPWYFIREVLRIPEDGAPIEIGGGVQYQIDRNNAACWYLFLNGIDHYQSKSRQRGKTQDCLGRMNYAYHFGAMASTFLFFNKDLELAKTNLYRMKCQRDMLPAYMQMKILIEEDGSIDKGTDNVMSMKNPINNNVVKVMPRAGSKDAAIRLGRGATAAFQYYDEFDFIAQIEEIMNTASFAYSRASENAIKNGSLHLRQLSSTPGDLNHRDGIAATKYISKMLHWKDSYFDKPINQLKKIINSVSYNGMVFVEHTWRQLKCSMEWYETQARNVNYNEEVILREIDLQRIKGSGASPFKRSDIIYINNHIREPIDELDYSKNLCPIMVYEAIHRNYPYILSVDPAEGLAQDNSAVSLINPYTLKIAAEFKSPYISQTDLGKMLIQFMDDKCPKSMIVVEANKGRETINIILDSKYRYQLYYDIDKLASKVVDNNDEYGAQKRAAYERRAYGFDTTKKSRSILFGILENIMEENKDQVDTKYIVDDISGLERSSSGKIAAGSESHDDNIMSYLIGLCVYYHATNLEEFGIRRGSRAPEDTTEEVVTRQSVREKIAGLLGLLKNDNDIARETLSDFIQETDPVEAAERYEREIQSIINAQSMTNDVIVSNMDTYYDMDTARGNALADSVFESNFRDTTVNIEDIVDSW